MPTTQIIRKEGIQDRAAFEKACAEAFSAALFGIANNMNESELSEILNRKYQEIHKQEKKVEIQYTETVEKTVSYSETVPRHPVWEVQSFGYTQAFREIIKYKTVYVDEVRYKTDITYFDEAVTFECCKRNNSPLMQQLFNSALDISNTQAVRALVRFYFTERCINFGSDLTVLEKTLPHLITEDSLRLFRNILAHKFSINPKTFGDSVNALTKYFINNTPEGIFFRHMESKANYDVTTVTRSFLEPSSSNEFFQSSFALFKHYLDDAIVDRNFKRIKLIKKNVESMRILHSEHKMRLLNMIANEEKKYQDNIMSSENPKLITKVIQDDFIVGDARAELFYRIFYRVCSTEERARDKITAELSKEMDRIFKLGQNKIDSIEAKLRGKLESELLEEHKTFVTQTSYSSAAGVAVADWKSKQIANRALLTQPIKPVEPTAAAHTASSSTALRVGLGVMFGFIGVAMITLSIVSCILSHGLSIGLSYQGTLFGVGLISNALWILAGGIAVTCAAEVVTKGKISSLFFHQFTQPSSAPGSCFHFAKNAPAALNPQY